MKGNLKQNWDILVAWVLPLIGFAILQIYINMLELCSGFCALSNFLMWFLGSGILGLVMLGISIFRFGFMKWRHFWFLPHILGIVVFITLIAIT